MNLYRFIRRRWVIWVWQQTPHCTEMTRLASQRLEQPLPLALRLRMRLHFLICVWCRRYFRQLEFLHRSAPCLDEHLAGFPQRGLSREGKARIIGQIRAALRM